MSDLHLVLVDTSVWVRFFRAEGSTNVQALDQLLSLAAVATCGPIRAEVISGAKTRREFQRLRDHQANGMGGLPLVGDPDAVASQMARLTAAGLTGIAVSFVNYLEELPYFCAEVLPRLARSGLREKR